MAIVRRIEAPIRLSDVVAGHAGGVGEWHGSGFIVSEGVRKTLSHAAIYGMGTVLANAAGIIMLPIYTRFLTPADYGLLEYLQMLMDVTSIVFGARALSGVFRIYFDNEDEHHRKSVICTSLVTDVVLHSLGAAMLILFAVPLADAFIGGTEYAKYIVIFALGLITMAMTSVPMVYLRILERPWMFITVSLLKLLCQIGLNIYLVVWLKMGALGVIISTVTTGVLVGGSLSAWTLYRTGWKVSRTTGVRLLRFGVPMALASMGAFYTTYGDRFFIKHYWGLAEVGIYALSYRFGFALSYLVFGTFNQVWGPQAYQVYREPDGVRTFRRVFLLIMLGLIYSATALSILAHDILRVMADPAFIDAAISIPVILLAYVVRSVGDFCGFGIRYVEKTKHFLHASILSVIVMTVGYVTLIPRWGALGAAFATLAGMLVESWWIIRISEKFVPLDLPWAKAFGAAVLGAAAFALGEYLVPDDLGWSIVAHGLILLSLAGAIVFSPIVGADERRAVVRLFGDVTAKLRVLRMSIKSP
jgi:O-antigen/teichoic acid export membrane protein